MSTPRKTAQKLFLAFLDKVTKLEGTTVYTNPQLKVEGDRMLFTAKGVCEEDPDRPFFFTIVYRKGSGNIFCYRDFGDEYFERQQSVRARGEEGLKEILQRLWTKVRLS